ncbi:MAG: phage tail protein [Ruminococcaceae bacterium]|nr:phage tail protein [Oscillospiraceae bacterium]
MKAGVINFAVYENGSEYLGVAKVTLPDTENKTFTVNGAGIAGDIDLPVPGHRNAMTATITFTDATEAAYKLAENRKHTIDLRAAHEEYDSTSGALKVKAYKHILDIIPKKLGGGDVAPATPQSISGEYSVLARKDYIDGILVRDIDPVNFKDVGADGTDSLAEVRSALGK